MISAGHLFYLMNAARRNLIEDLLERARTLNEEIEAVQEQEQEAFNNLPEGLQQADNGQKMEAAADALQSAHDSLEDVITSLEEATV